MHKTRDVVGGLKKLVEEPQEINIAQFFVGVDYSDLESKAIAMLLENNGGGICLKELYQPFEDEEHYLEFRDWYNKIF